MARTPMSVAAAFDEQATEVTAWLRRLAHDDFDRPSVLDGWSVRVLVGHLLMMRLGLGARLDTRGDGRPVPIHEYVRRYRPAAADIETMTLAAAGDDPGRRLVERFAAVPPASEAVDGVDARSVVQGPRGPLTTGDWLTTRLIDLVVHCDDLSRSVPGVDPVPLVRPALADVTRQLARIFAAQHPGHTVEVRIPPFAAVQAIKGPTHSRGTPPNVVETDAVTWLRLATGRLSYADAVVTALVRASGPRSDLGEYLPVLS